jgi:Zn-dependent protease with chaperone function
LSTVRIVQSPFVRTLFLLLISLYAAFAQARDPVVYDPPPEVRQKAIALHRQIDVLHFGSVAWDLAVLLLLIRARVGQRFRDAAVRRFRSRFLQNAATTVAILAALWVADLPVAAYRHWLSLRYGLSVQRWGPWFLDVLKGDLIAGVIAALLIVAMLAAARRWPARWWVYGWALCVATMAALTYLSPLVFEPLFFEFKPLAGTNPALTAGLKSVAARAGYAIPEDRIYEMDASTKTRAVNAYMTGFGHSRRIVIWDTTLRALTPAEVESVFAHELGHYALHHIPQSLALGAAGLFMVLWLIRFGLARFIAQPERGLRGFDDPAVLPVVFAAALVVSFVAEPIVNTYSRWQEHQADIYELEAMHGLVADAGRNSAEVGRKMAEIDLDDPEPNRFIAFWMYTHPTTQDRIYFAQTYDAWPPGKRPKYVR